VPVGGPAHGRSRAIAGRGDGRHCVTPRRAVVPTRAHRPCVHRGRADSLLRDSHQRLRRSVCGAPASRASAAAGGGSSVRVGRCVGARASGERRLAFAATTSGTAGTPSAASRWWSTATAATAGSRLIRAPKTAGAARAGQRVRDSEDDRGRDRGSLTRQPDRPVHRPRRPVQEATRASDQRRHHHRPRSGPRIRGTFASAEAEAKI